jgi:uncharacterized paraquat-inducible protein A
MSTSATEPQQVRPAAEEPSPQGARCASCGAPLASEQEWCLECGAARTKVHRAADWRIPVALIAVLLVLVLAALVFALIELSIDANRSAGAVALGSGFSAIAAPGR